MNPNRNLNSKQGPRIRAGTPHSIDNMTITERCREQSELDRIICRPHVADILIYITEKGECMKGDVYRNVCRGAAAMDRLEVLRDAGLIEASSDSGPGPCFLRLTIKGIEVAETLKRLDDIISRPSECRIRE